MPAIGKVSTQAVRMVPGHAPADGGEALGGARRPSPAEVIVWVVEIGASKTNAVV